MADTPALRHLAAPAADTFFVVAVEQMYQSIPKEVPPTRDTAHTCLFLTSGTATMRIGNDTYTIQAGEALIVRAGQVFSFQPGDINTGFLCHFHHDFLISQASLTGAPTYKFLTFWGHPKVALDAQTAEFVRQLLHRLLIEYTQHQLRYTEVLRGYLQALLSELNRAYKASLPTNDTAAAQLTNRFKQLLATTIKSTHLVSRFAELLHITPNHLTKCVRSTTDKSPAKWIDEAIVLEAKVLLYQSQLSISEIAQEVGLEDPSYFSRLFKKHEGVTPLAFRKMIEKS